MNKRVYIMIIVMMIRVVLRDALLSNFSKIFRFGKLQRLYFLDSRCNLR
jgi:hypothetical protein